LVQPVGAAAPFERCSYNVRLTAKALEVQHRAPGLPLLAAGVG
jgi:hypothetical protein